MNLSSIVLADFDVVRNMGSRFHGKHAQLDLGDLCTFLGIVLFVAVIAWLLSRLTSRQERSRRSNSPRALFHELCQVHGLDRASRRLLWRLARHHQLAHPARLFLEPERFDHGTLGPVLQAQAEQCARLQQRLFAGDECSESVAPAAEEQLAIEGEPQAASPAEG